MNHFNANKSRIQNPKIIQRQQGVDNTSRIAEKVPFGKLKMREQFNLLQIEMQFQYM